MAVRSYQNVLRFQVAVDVALVMAVLQRERDLGYVQRARRLRQQGFVDSIVEVPARHELEHEEDVVGVLGVGDWLGIRGEKVYLGQGVGVAKMESSAIVT